jgi:zinc/manganese transport system ATP-binding protein
VSAVEFAGVALALGGRSILAQASFSISDGEFVGVLGPNGAGKTTVMRAILGLIQPSIGSLRVLGGPAGSANAAIGYMPQHRQAAAGLSIRGWDFVASAVDGHRWGIPLGGRRVRNEVTWALDKVGAGDLAARPLAQLSGGERQRLLLAQVLLGRPRLLLVDEPLMNLDPHHQRAVVELIQRLNRELGIAVLFSAHELNPLLGALDRVLYLGSGQAALGRVDEVITAPVLSRLYGSPIEVVRLGSRIFVMSGEHNVEQDAHLHEGNGRHDHSAHGHSDHGHHA